MPPGESVVLKSCIAKEGYFDYLGNPARSVVFCMALPKEEALGWDVTQGNPLLIETYKQSREAESGLCRAYHKLTEYTPVYACLPRYPSPGRKTYRVSLGFSTSEQQLEL